MRGSVPHSPHLLLALVVVVWAGSYAAIKQLIDDGLAAPDIALGRYVVAAPGFAIALVATRGLPGLGRRDLARLIVAGLLGVTIHRVSELDAGGILLLLYLGLAATLAGYIGWTRGLRRLDASRTVAYLYGVPVVAIVIGALTLGEAVTVWLGLGGVLVVAGM